MGDGVDHDSYRHNLRRSVVKVAGVPMKEGLAEHSGSKYIRRIWATGIKPAEGQMGFVDVDFYDIINALGINNPAIQHCLKKLMYAGARHKGSRSQDLREARDALSRAIELEEAAESIPPTQVRPA